VAGWVAVSTASPPPEASPLPRERPPSSRRRVLVAGATGYIGRHAVRALVDRGHDVVCLARPRAGVGGTMDEAAIRAALPGAEVRFAEVTDGASLRRDGFRGEGFDAVVSCLATRHGGIEDSWRIEHRANRDLLAAARAGGAQRFVLLSAICVQRPKLAFQHAKRAFEAELQGSGLTWTIVRPTAFFKSLSGQVRRVQSEGRPFLVFGDGRLTACKPIAEEDLAAFLADCLEDPAANDAVLPVGGPGAALTPLDQAEILFRLLRRPPRIRRVPVALLDGIIATTSALSRIVPSLRDKAELARIGRYYATESMLLYDPEVGRYDADATPSYGTRTLEAHYDRILREGLAGQELGDHAVFGEPRSG